MVQKNVQIEVEKQYPENLTQVDIEPYRRGASGNPKGRPPLGMSIAEQVRKIGAQIPSKSKDSRMTSIILRLFRDARNGKTAAAQLLLDRAYGKPAQPIGGAEELGPILIEAMTGYNYDTSIAPLAPGSVDDSFGEVESGGAGDGEEVG